MKIYEKYIIKLLFVRFGVVLLCTSIFGIFQETMKGELLAMCSFAQMFIILPLMLPFILFQFLPFIYFGVLLLVLTEIYSNNELISFKTTGISNKLLMFVFFKFSCFVLLFFAVLAIIYPSSNKLFLKQRNNFGVGNVLKTLKPGKLNRIGGYNVFFTKIDKHNKLYNVTIFSNTKNNKNNTQQQKIFFNKVVNLVYNNDELIAQCDDVDVVGVKFNNYAINNMQTNNNDNNFIQYSTKVNTSNVLLDDFFYKQKTPEIKEKQKLRQTGILTLFKNAKNVNFTNNLQNLEIHSRVFVYWFVILTLTSISCLLLTKYTNRIKATKKTTFVIISMLFISMTKAFVLQKMVDTNTVVLFYIGFIAVMFCCVCYLYRSDAVK